MTALQACGDVGQVRHDQRRRVIAGVAAGQEDRIESRQVGKHRVERLERLRPPCRILQIEVRRCPQPVLDVVLLADGAEASIHRLARDRHQRADAGVLERDVLDGVAAEQRDLADVLVELRVGPAVVGVRVMAVAELMAADGVPRRRLDVDGGIERRGSPAPRERAEQSSDAEERAAGVGAEDPDDRPSLARAGHQAIGFRSHGDRRHRRAPFGRGADSNRHRDTLRRPLVARRPDETGALLDLFAKHVRGESFGGGVSRAARDHDRGRAQVNRSG